MSNVIGRPLLLAGIVVALASGACSKPEPPTLQPKEARVNAVGVAGVDMLVRLEVTNPNGFTLSARSVTGKAKLDGKWDLGTMTLSKPFTLPAKQATTLDVPMSLPWSDVSTVGALAMATQPVPYVVEGTVTIGGETINVDLPYKLEGTITREQIVGAALKGLSTLPGLSPPR